MGIPDPPDQRRFAALLRHLQPEDVAGPVVFLASDRAAFVAGQSLNVCAGIVLG